jgi:hypothetical protein
VKGGVRQLKHEIDKEKERLTLSSKGIAEDRKSVSYWREKSE